MTTKCYAMVRGSAIRVTGLTDIGSLPEQIPFAVSKAVAKVQINEITEGGSNELVKTEDDESRLHFVNPAEMIRYTADINFLRVDPGMFSLVAGVGVVTNAAGDVTGFDAVPRKPATSFALEVWSQIAGNGCSDGERQYGYTLLPYLRGGVLSGFTFQNGLVSFDLLGAKTRRMPRWGVGPYDLTGPGQRLDGPVSRNTMYRTMLSTAPPPAVTCGIETFEDVVDGGDAFFTSAGVIDGEFVETSPWILDGGQAV